MNASDWCYQLRWADHWEQAFRGHSLIAGSDPWMNFGSYCRRDCWLHFFELQATRASGSPMTIGLKNLSHQILADLWNQMRDCASKSSASSVLACEACFSLPQHHYMSSHNWVGSIYYWLHPFRDLRRHCFRRRPALHSSCLNSPEVHSVQHWATSLKAVKPSVGSVPRFGWRNRLGRSLCSEALGDL